VAKRLEKGRGEELQGKVVDYAKVDKKGQQRGGKKERCGTAVFV